MKEQEVLNFSISGYNFAAKQLFERRCVYSWIKIYNILSDRLQEIM